ncbi:MAG TPA: nuclear transport factor 2 family protein [Acidimicrobiales bacterium]|nr:nuclear transport factor 2 family protein [Acidimicrobiales bacterium]
MAPVPPDAADVADVLAANRRYYEAFEAADLDAMAACWERSDRVVCTHPGWPTLRGWGKVESAWFALFQQGPPMQFVLTQERAMVVGDAAWVSLDENLLGDAGGVTIASLNCFVRAGAGWRMVAHQGSVVHAADDGEP